jgi:SAM-dependent methyltransferase
MATKGWLGDHPHNMTSDFRNDLATQAPNHPSVLTATELTQRYYNDNGLAYAERTLQADMSDAYRRFLRQIPPGSRVLDVGCGAGRDLLAFSNRGYQVTGIDSSSTMVGIAIETSGAPCHVVAVEDMQFRKQFEGAWACASLLHISKCRFGAALAKIHTALIDGGAMFVSMQEGNGEKTAPDERFFAYYSIDELKKAIATAGFDILESWASTDSLGRSSQQWINVIARATVQSR